jgi:hypothetical protein
MISNGSDSIVVISSKRATLVVVEKVLRQEAMRSPFQKDMITKFQKVLMSRTAL